jgi:hypothetical protein
MSNSLAVHEHRPRERLVSAASAANPPVTRAAEAGPEQSTARWRLRPEATGRTAGRNG